MGASDREEETRGKNRSVAMSALMGLAGAAGREAFEDSFVAFRATREGSIRRFVANEALYLPVSRSISLRCREHKSSLVRARPSARSGGSASCPEAEGRGQTFPVVPSAKGRHRAALGAARRERLLSPARRPPLRRAAGRDKAEGRPRPGDIRGQFGVWPGSGVVRQPPTCLPRAG